MNAYEIPSLRFSMPAGGAIERGRFVSVDSNGNAIQATASTQIVGVSMNKVTAKEGVVNPAGQIAEIADGIVIVEAAGAITAGATVYSDANGKATSSGTVIAGVSITGAAAAGNYTAVKL